MNGGFEYYIDRCMESIERIGKENQDVAAREMFEKEIGEEFEDFCENKDFMILMLRENIIAENEEINKY
ncbi:hypothetical protein [Bacillus pumilus]|uniref:hypothetical protein n=1 Tax=Bacillus pumilus TaxID=1408 RepID=UPI00119D55DD|nr:hypothetical protein [Bacillus pumilus]